MLHIQKGVMCTFLVITPSLHAIDYQAFWVVPIASAVGYLYGAAQASVYKNDLEMVLAEDDLGQKRESLLLIYPAVKFFITPEINEDEWKAIAQKDPPFWLNTPDWKSSQETVPITNNNAQDAPDRTLIDIVQSALNKANECRIPVKKGTCYSMLGLGAGGLLVGVYYTIVNNLLSAS